MSAISVPQDDAVEHFGFMGMFVGMDMPASSAWTRKTLGWEPSGPSLISDLKRMDYGVSGAM